MADERSLESSSDEASTRDSAANHQSATAHSQISNDDPKQKAADQLDSLLNAIAPDEWTIKDSRIEANPDPIQSHPDPEQSSPDPEQSSPDPPNSEAFQRTRRVEEDWSEVLASAHESLMRASFEPARQAYEKALELLDSTSLPHQEQLEGCLSDLADVYMFLGEPDLALTMRRRLHALEGTHSDRSYIVVLMQVAGARERTGDVAGAEALYQEAVMVAADILPPDDPLRDQMTKSLVSLHSKRSAAFSAHKSMTVDEISGDDGKPQPLHRRRSTLSGEEELAVEKPIAHTTPWLQTILEHPLLHTQIMRSRMLLTILSSILLLCSVALFSVLHFERKDVRTVKVVEHQQGDYKSCDNRKSLRLLSAAGCDLVQHGQITHGKLKILTDSDFLTLSTTPKQNREIWFQQTDAGLIDQDGTILYAKDSPELFLARKIEKYGKLVSAKFQETKLYPSDASKLEKVTTSEFRYTNPFSGKAVQPIVLYKRFAAADKTWTDQTKSGLVWPDEPPWRAGDIHCVCLDYCRFFVRGFDRNARPLTGSEPGSCFFVELKDGMNLTAGQLAQTSSVIDDKDRIPLTVYISNAPGMQLTIETLRQLIPIVLWIVFLISVGWFARSIIRKSNTTVAHTTKFKS